MLSQPLTPLLILLPILMVDAILVSLLQVKNATSSDDSIGNELHSKYSSLPCGPSFNLL